MLHENAYDKYKKLDDLPVKAKVILPPEGIVRKGIIQFHHGMSEHKSRYYDTMEYFAKHGYVCAIHDARGHGESMVNDSELGYFGEMGTEICVEDAHAVTAFLKNNYPDLPLILIGHSFGSLVARAYIKKYDYELDQAFIVGCPGDNKAKIFGMLVIELLTIFQKDTEVNMFVHRRFSNQYDKKYKKICAAEGKTYRVNGQICTDDAVVEAYNKDIKCGFAYTLNGYYTIMNTMKEVYNGSTSRWVLKNKKMPITFVSGADDVYMLGRKKLDEAIERMKQIGYINVDLLLYEGMYHEVFNEPGKERVYRDILEKIEKNLK